MPADSHPATACVIYNSFMYVLWLRSTAGVPAVRLLSLINDSLLYSSLW